MPNEIYALFDTTCCFCAKGSGARVYIASSPLGPYTQTTNINRDATSSPIIHAQQTYVATLPTPTGAALLWMADRWGSRPDHIKGHDFQYWALLHIAPDGSVQPLAYTPTWTLAVRTGTSAPTSHTLYSWPTKPDPHPLAADACTHQPLTPVESGSVLP